MDAWHWPHYLVALATAAGFAATSIRTIRNRDITTERATLLILVWTAYFAGYVYTLYEGGFWP